MIRKFVNKKKLIDDQCYKFSRKCVFSFDLKVSLELAVLILSGNSFQSLAPRYLIELKPHLTVFFLVK